MASTRRDRGDGSIRKRSNGKWEGRISYVNDMGKFKTKSVYGDTQAEARRKLKELIKEMERMADDDEYLKPTELTFGEWLDTWMKDYKKNSVRPATYRYCKRIWSGRKRKKQKPVQHGIRTTLYFALMSVRSSNRAASLPP